MKDQIEDLIIAFFEGDLPESQVELLMQKRKETEAVEALFQEYATLYGKLEEEELVLPSPHLKTRFEQSLAESKAEIKTKEKFVVLNQRKPSKQYFYAIAASLLLCIGLGAGYLISNQLTMRTMQKEMALLRSSMKSLLKNESTSVRIQAVNLTNDLAKADEDVLVALIKTMNSDPSENVKMAAINALGKFAQETIVKKALIKALSEENSSYVQIKLIKILSNIKAKSALPFFEQLIEDEKTLPFVKYEAEEAKLKITSL